MERAITVNIVDLADTSACDLEPIHNTSASRLRT